MAAIAIKKIEKTPVNFTGNSLPRIEVNDLDNIPVQAATTLTQSTLLTGNELSSPRRNLQAYEQLIGMHPEWKTAIELIRSANDLNKHNQHNYQGGIAYTGKVDFVEDPISKLVDYGQKFSDNSTNLPTLQNIDKYINFAKNGRGTEPHKRTNDDVYVANMYDGWNNAFGGHLIQEQKKTNAQKNQAFANVIGRVNDYNSYFSGSKLDRLPIIERLKSQLTAHEKNPYLYQAEKDHIDSMLQDDEQKEFAINSMKLLKEATQGFPANSQKTASSEISRINIEYKKTATGIRTMVHKLELHGAVTGDEGQKLTETLEAYEQSTSEFQQYALNALDGEDDPELLDDIQQSLTNSTTALSEQLKTLQNKTSRKAELKLNNGETIDPYLANAPRVLSGILTQTLANTAKVISKTSDLLDNSIKDHPLYAEIISRAADQKQAQHNTFVAPQREEKITASHDTFRKAIKQAQGSIDGSSLDNQTATSINAALDTVQDKMTDYAQYALLQNIGEQDTEELAQIQTDLRNALSETFTTIDNSIKSPEQQKKIKEFVINHSARTLRTITKTLEDENSDVQNTINFALKSKKVEPPLLTDIDRTQEKIRQAWNASNNTVDAIGNIATDYAQLALAKSAGENLVYEQQDVEKRLADAASKFFNEVDDNFQDKATNRAAKEHMLKHAQKVVGEITNNAAQKDPSLNNLKTEIRYIIASAIKAKAPTEIAAEVETQQSSMNTAQKMQADSTGIGAKAAETLMNDQNPGPYTKLYQQANGIVFETPQPAEEKTSWLTSTFKTVKDGFGKLFGTRDSFNDAAYKKPEFTASPNIHMG